MTVLEVGGGRGVGKETFIHVTPTVSWAVPMYPGHQGYSSTNLPLYLSI